MWPSGVSIYTGKGDQMNQNTSRSRVRKREMKRRGKKKNCFRNWVKRKRKRMEMKRKLVCRWKEEEKTERARRTRKKT